jgi:hypothetical protein
LYWKFAEKSSQKNPTVAVKQQWDFVQLLDHGVPYEFRSHATIFTGLGATITPKTPLIMKMRLTVHLC